jgi:hypothetical protein
VCHAHATKYREAMSDEVTSFLRSVEQLKEKREVEDEARSRELEEKILQDRRERQARRAGRLSPNLCLVCCRVLPPALLEEQIPPPKASLAPALQFSSCASFCAALAVAEDCGHC